MEPWGEVMARASAWWKKEVIAYVKSLDEGPGNILITSHGGLIAALVASLISSIPPIQVADGVVLGRCYNASITVIELDRKTLSGNITQYSETSHLSGQFVENNPDDGQVTLRK
jgi:probable phosphoglycerate mutase